MGPGQATWARVWRAVRRWLTNAEIARRLVVSDKAVRNHVSNVFAKLHVTGRPSAVARARDAGMGAAPTH